MWFSAKARNPFTVTKNPEAAEGNKRNSPKTDRPFAFAIRRLLRLIAMKA